MTNTAGPEPLWLQKSDPTPSRAKRLPPFLFVHGDFATGEMSWSRQWSGLTEERSLIVIDRRGHGRSPVEPFPYTLHQDGSDVLEVVRRLGEGAVELVGHSYGAIVALEATCREPHSVSALHLVEPPYLSLLPADPDVAGLNRDARSLHEMSRSLAPEELAHRFFTAVIGEAAVQQLREKPVWSAIVREATRFAHEEFVGAYPAERLQDLPKSLPVTIYSGGRSHPALRRLAHELHKRLPGSELITFPDAGHDVQRIGAPFDTALCRARQVLK